MAAPVPVAPGVFGVRDTCTVYVVVAESPADDGARTAVCIDFGAGDVLDHLAAMGVDRITDVLLTHHHRDQAQGLPPAVAAGNPVHVPPVERDLFDGVEDLWRGRPLHADYSLRQDRFSLLEAGFSSVHTKRASGFDLWAVAFTDDSAASDVLADLSLTGLDFRP